MKFYRIAAILVSIWAVSPPVFASLAYVSLAGPGGSVSQFNAASGTLAATFAVPPGAVDLLTSADGSKLYVGTSTAGQADVRSGAPAVVAVLDSSLGTVLHQYKMPGSVVKMVLNSAGDHIFATGLAGANETAVVMSLNLKTAKTALAALPGASAFSLYTLGISPDGNTLYVPVNNAIDVFNSQTLASAGSIALTQNGIVAPPAVTTDGATLFAAGAGSVYAVDLTTKVLKTTIPITATEAAFGSVLSPDGKTFYVSAGTLSAIDVASLTVKGAVALGQTNPFRLGISPDGATLFASDLTYGTTAVVDATSLTVGSTIYSIAPPYAVEATGNGSLFVLNENSTGLALVDTDSMAVTGGFMAGDSPGTPVIADGKMFIPEVSNLAVQETPLTPITPKTLADNFIVTQDAVVLGGRVYASESSFTRVVNPVAEKVTKSFNINTGGGAVNAVAGSGDGESLLATYIVIGIGIVITDAGIVKVDTAAGTQTLLSSLPFVPGAVASSADGTRAYAVGSNNGNQVGVWDTQNNVFLKAATISGNPFYLGIAVSKDGSTLYLVDQKGKVDFVSASTLKVIASVALGTKPLGISVSADGTQGIVTDSTATSITVLDLVNRAVKGTVALGAPSAGSVYLN